MAKQSPSLPEPSAQDDVEPVQGGRIDHGRRITETLRFLVRPINGTLRASANGLIAVWSELTHQAAAIHDTRGELQGSLEL